LIYGDGVTDVDLKDMKTFSPSEDILVGGQSFTTQTQGEGFLMRVDKYGKPAFKKLYTSGAANGDSIHKVFAYNDNSFAVGYSLVGASHTYFLLSIGPSGTVTNQHQIASDTTKVGTDSIIYEMYTTDGTTVITAFKGTIGGVGYDVLSILTLGGLGSPISERYIGLTGQTDTQLMGAFISGSVFTVTGMLDCHLFELVYDSGTPSNSKARYIKDDVCLQVSDWAILDMNPIHTKRMISLDRAGGIFVTTFTPNAGDYSTFDDSLKYGDSGAYFIQPHLVNNSRLVDIYHLSSSRFYARLLPLDGSGAPFIRYTPLGSGAIEASVTSSSFVYAQSIVGRESISLTAKQSK
jgi:hypothetical protein